MIFHFPESECIFPCFPFVSFVALCGSSSFIFVCLLEALSCLPPPGIFVPPPLLPAFPPPELLDRNQLEQPLLVYPYLGWFACDRRTCWTSRREHWKTFTMIIRSTITTATPIVGWAAGCWAAGNTTTTRTNRWRFLAIRQQGGHGCKNEDSKDHCYGGVN